MQDFIDLLEKHYAQYLLCTFLFFLLISIRIFVTFKHKDDKWYEVNPNRSIHSHVLFWMSIVTPFFIILALKFPAFLMYISKDEFSFYKMVLSRDITKDFLSIIALIAPLSLLIIRMHSSKQTAEQLENQKDQLSNQATQLENQQEQLNNQKIQLQNQQEQLNNQKSSDSFKHYLEHRSYIIEKLDEYKNHKNCLVTFNSSDIYQLIFPDLSLRSFDFKVFTEPSVVLKRMSKELDDYTLKFLHDGRNLQKLKSTAEGRQDLKRIMYHYFRDINFMFGFNMPIKEGVEVTTKGRVGNKDYRPISIMVKKPGNLDSSVRNFTEETYHNATTLITKFSNICGLPECDDFNYEIRQEINHQLGEIWDFYNEYFKEMTDYEKPYEYMYAKRKH